MLYQFNKHCEQHSLIPDYQSAYREGYSCETSLLRLINDVLWTFEQGQAMSIAICDLSAAFDTVCHKTLLHVLEERCGVGPRSIKWYDQYLRPRSLKVTVNSAVSCERELTVSVPQGSTAGANIFTAYSATLDDVVPADLLLNGFADDHSIRKEFDPTSMHSVNQTKSLIELTMIKIKEWMNLVRLKMNDPKTKFIIFQSGRKKNVIEWKSINVNGIDIQRSDVVRLLGAWLDSKLSMKEHITKKAKTASLNLQRLKMIRR